MLTTGIIGVLVMIFGEKKREKEVGNSHDKRKYTTNAIHVATSHDIRKWIHARGPCYYSFHYYFLVVNRIIIRGNGCAHDRYIILAFPAKKTIDNAREVAMI